MDRVLRGVPPTASLALYGPDGTPTDPVGNPATTIVDVADGAGAPVAQALPTQHPATGSFTCNLPALPNLDTYTLTWALPDGTMRATELEVVGGAYFAVADLRAWDSDLADATAYPAAAVVEAREIVEEDFEHATGVAWVPRGRRLTLDGSGDYALRVPNLRLRRVVSARVDGALLADQSTLVPYPSGVIMRPGAIWPLGYENVQVQYEHGMDAPPAPLVRAAKRYARHLLVRGGLDQNERATAVFTDLGGYRLSIAGRDGWTGLPEVDAVLERYSSPAAGIA